MTDNRQIDPGLRLRLILGKFRIVNVEKGASGFRATVDLHQGIKMTIDCPLDADVQLWDLLTFYTEVPHAKLIEPPKQ